VTVRLAFYKGKSTWKDRLIRLWTFGPYSHVELLIDDVAFSSVVGVGTRYLSYPVFIANEWDYVDIPMSSLDKAHMWSWCMSELGCGYDWKGLICCQVLGLAMDDPKDWFCSEYVITALQVAGKLKAITSYKESPNSLSRYVARHPVSVA